MPFIGTCAPAYEAGVAGLILSSQIVAKFVIYTCTDALFISFSRILGIKINYYFLETD